MARMSRRRLFRGAGLALGGAAAGAAAGGAGTAYANGIPITGDRLPLGGGYAPITGSGKAPAPAHHDMQIHWAVPTDRKLVALTFDDGPGPEWTPRVHDILDATATPATFFLVGQHVQQHGDLIRGRMGRHEAGNHTWSHSDLAMATYEQARDVLTRTHHEITEVTGKAPTLLRPPWGHIGGSALRAAGELGYSIVAWSLQMPESTYVHHPKGLVDYVVRHTLPGTIILAHDIGVRERLVTINGLTAMIKGLRARGFEFVTVSQLVAAGTPAPTATQVSH